MANSAEWKKYTIGELCETVSISYKRKDDYVILVNTSDVLDGKVLNHKPIKNEKLKGQFKKTFKKDDILYSEIRPINKRFAYIDFEDTLQYIASTKLMVLRSFLSVIRPKYLYNILRSTDMITVLQHLAETRSGTFPQITFTTELSTQEVLVPDFPTQDKIISVTDAFDKQIENNLLIIKNLREQILKIYKNKFIDIDINNQIKNLGWKKQTLLRNELTLVLKPGVNKFETKQYYPTAEVDGINFSDGNTVQFATRESRANMQPVIDSVWFAKMKNSIKHLYLNSAMVGFIENSILSTGFCGIKCLKGSFEYVAAFIMNPYFEALKDQYAHGTTQEAINQDDLDKVEFIVPDKNSLLEFSESTKSMFENINNLLIENKKLIKSRDVLINAMVKSELDVSGVKL